MEGVCQSAADRPGVGLQPMLRGLVAGDGVEREPRLDEFHEPLTRPLDHVLLAGRKLRPVRGRAFTGREGDHRAETLEREAAGERGHSFDTIHAVGGHAGCGRRGQGEPLPLGRIGKRQVDGGDGRVRRQPGMHLGERVGEHHHGHIHPP